MKEYQANIVGCSRELTPIEKYKVCDTLCHTSLDEATANGEVVLDVDFIAQVEIHNEKSKGEKDYRKVVVMTRDGKFYTTGSESFESSVLNIIDIMADAGVDEYSIKAYRVPSKNYQGRDFITATIV